VLSIGFTLLAGLMMLHVGWLLAGHLKLETDILKLLPLSSKDPVKEEALAQLASNTSHSVVVLLEGERDAVLVGGQAFSSGADQTLLRRIESQNEQDMLKGLLPFRASLLSQSSIRELETLTESQLKQKAIETLSMPVEMRLGEFRDDPLNCFAAWAQERAAGSRLHPVGPFLGFESASKPGQVSILLRFEVQKSLFSLDGNPRLNTELERLKALLPKGVRAFASGVPLFAESAAVQANHEVTTVGFGSLLAIVLLMILAFRSPLPLVLVVSSVLMGVVAGLSLTVLFFEKIHLITLVFGASLVGVAEDYGIHYFASRQSAPALSPHDLVRELFPGLFMAWLTSVAGFGMLALAPFPGLRQVAVFSSAGLTAAFWCVVAWFPWLDRGAPAMTTLARQWGASRHRLPQLSRRRLVLLVTMVLAGGLIAMNSLHAQDDVRLLQSVPQDLLSDSQHVAQAIGLPSPAQFYVVRGATVEEILEREERLGEVLRESREKGFIKGFDSMAQWVPPKRTREHQKKIFERARLTVMNALKDELEDPSPSSQGLDDLTVERFVALPLGRAFAPLVLNDAHVVLLHSPLRDRLSDLKGLTQHLPGVELVDRTADMSSLIERWRLNMSYLLVLGYAVIFAALFARLRFKAINALMPTLIASCVSLSAVAVLGEPLTLFHVLALWLLLGVGVDYGIFLAESQDGTAWFAVGLGAVSTFLSFGLLATSSTPALHAFGVTLGVGIIAVWILAPLLAPSQVPSS
jgi:predicted exporter